jgi:hypothetical protein
MVGCCASRTCRTSRNTPARKVEIRVRAPDTFVLIIVWPIMAQPPMPPKAPVTRFATPWPHVSRVLFECESVTSSTSLAVIRDSRMPTSATARAYGAMTRRVAQVSGTSGNPRVGRLSGRAPWSPTVGSPRPSPTTTAVISTIETSGAGTTLVSLGRSTITAIPAATIG